jgi:hypothetical protein
VRSLVPAHARIVDMSPEEPGRYRPEPMLTYLRRPGKERP